MKSLLCFLAALSLCASLGAAPSKPVLEFTRLDLLDGRKLRNVVVKSYDAKTGKVLLLADRQALTVSLGLIPPPFSESLRTSAPPAGRTVSPGANPPALPPSTPPRNDPPPPARPAEAPSRQNAAAHRAVAIDRALTFFRYEFKAGSDAMRVDSVKIDAGPATPVAGWSGRYRTQGKAYLELFDTKGWSATRAESSFEVITEQKPGEPITVIDFSRKT